MNQATNTLMHTKTFLVTALVALGVAAGPAFARSDVVVHIDIPEIGLGGKDQGPDYLYEWIGDLSLDYSSPWSPIGIITPNGPMGPGAGYPTLVIQPYSTDDPGLPGLTPIRETIAPVPVGSGAPVSPIPSPAGGVLVGLGAAVLAGRRRR